MPRFEADHIPARRHHKASGKAVVTLNGRDHYLGDYEDPGSIRRYQSLIAEWLAGGGRLSPSWKPQTVTGPTVAELLLAYIRFAKTYYRKHGERTEEFCHIERAIRPLRALYDALPVAEFSPLKLKAVRDEFVKTGTTRTHVNTNTQRIKRIFRWGTENEMVPAGVYHALQAVSGLRKGRSDAKEGRKVRPVPIAYVDAVLPHVLPEVAALIRLQLLTGARSGELIIMRTVDIDMAGDVWCYRPTRFKTEHVDGATREIWLGRQAQEILRPWLRSNLHEYLFSPGRAMERQAAARRAARRTKLSPSQLLRDNRRRAKPKRHFEEHYTTESFRRAIVQAIDILNRKRREAGEPEIPAWHPHQLRHNHATDIRRRFGLEIAKAVLGHRDVRATEIYAEMDSSRAREVAEQVG